MEGPWLQGQIKSLRLGEKGCFVDIYDEPPIGSGKVKIILRTPFGEQKDVVDEAVIPIEEIGGWLDDRRDY